MKRLVFMFALVLGLAQLAGARNYFQPGTVWIESGVRGVGQPVTTNYYTLSEYIDVEGEMVMECGTIDPETEEFKPYPLNIKTEGDKVFWRSTYAETPEWYLMYDFSLQPGDEVTVYAPETTKGYQGAIHYSVVKCIEIYTSPEEGGAEMMNLQEFQDSHPNNEDDKGTWIVGAGSIFGMTIPNFFDRTPNNFRIDKVTLKDGEVVYDNGLSKVEQIHEAEFNVHSDGLNISVSGIDNETLVKVYSLDGKTIGEFFGNGNINLPATGVYIVKAGNSVCRVSI